MRIRPRLKLAEKLLWTVAAVGVERKRWIMKENTNARIKSCYLDIVSEGSVCKLEIFHGDDWAEEPRKAVHA